MKPRRTIRRVSKSEYRLLNIPQALRSTKVYVTNTRSGYANSENSYVTIPLWAQNREPAYFLYYIAHELSHILTHLKFDRKAYIVHGKDFYQCFRHICPTELQHYELHYKPRGANGKVKRV